MLQGQKFRVCEECDQTEAGLAFELAADLADAIARIPAERPCHGLLRLLEKSLPRVLH
jgi:hypothetical protein